MKRSHLILTGLIAVGTIGAAWADQPIVSHNNSFSKEGLFKANVSTLKDTQLVLSTEAPLEPSKNVLWCGTFQLAWNKAIGLVGEKLQFAHQPPIVDLLNRESFTEADLDPASYVALADFERNNVEDEIRAALEKTFHGAASPELIPAQPLHPGPDDFVAYAYLYKNLSFLKPFDENDHFTFAQQKVASFGFSNNKGHAKNGLPAQVTIFDYQSEDDFIIKLKTKSSTDELILAKIPPGATLQATLDTVLHRVSTSKPVQAEPRDTLTVPKFNFDLRESFKDLEGLVLTPSATAHVKDGLHIAKAEQLVRFQLNEKGAILKSEAVVVMMMAMAPTGPPPHIMNFDKPFLVLMKQANVDKPYFVLWVGNASLLVPLEKK